MLLGRASSDFASVRTPCGPFLLPARDVCLQGIVQLASALERLNVATSIPSPTLGREVYTPVLSKVKISYRTIVLY